MSSRKDAEHIWALLGRGGMSNREADVLSMLLGEFTDDGDAIYSLPISGLAEAMDLPVSSVRSIVSGFIARGFMSVRYRSGTRITYDINIEAIIDALTPSRQTDGGAK